MRIDKFFIMGVAVSVLNYSCSNVDHQLSEGLDFAGKNRSELEKVLEHYGRPADSLKLKAAQFLIANMPFHYGYYGKGINTYANIFSIIDTLSYTHESVSNEDKVHIGDSIVHIYGWPNIDSAQKVYDSKALTADFLINNIDFAFMAWQNTPWSKQVPFGDFCEYILPYRIKNERAEFWRPQFYYQYGKMAANVSDSHSAMAVFDAMKGSLSGETTFTMYFDKYYPFGQSISDVKDGRIGSCEMTCFYAASAMRAVGLPVGFEYIMHWGNEPNRHYTLHLAGHFDTRSLITNENVQEDTWHLVDASSELNTNRHKFTKDEMPKGLYVQNVRTIPKVYRYTFSPSLELLDINKTTPSEFISPEFAQTNLKDVTDEYVTTSKVDIQMDSEFNKFKVGYLCVFDIAGWQPVAITKINGKIASFKKVGKEIVYLPTVYHDGEQWPTGAPFFIDSLNVIHKIVMDSDSKQDMTLLRKYPLFIYTAYHTEILKGGRFEGSNDSAFSNPTVLYEIKNYPFFVNIVPSNSDKKFRYFRYVASSDANFEPDNIAEVQFLDGDGKSLTGRFMGVDGVYGHEISKAFDNDLNSYYQNYRNRDGWIGIDLGKGVRKRAKAIKFCPRNDTDGIIPGQEYELFYWDGQNWNSLGVQTATGYSLTYKDAPQNALFWLRCNSGGTEERIFTYINGMQVWW